MQNAITQIQFDYFKNILTKEGILDIKARGGCMWPFFRDGQVVRILPASMGEVAVGEVMLTYVDKRFFCHRVIRKGEDFIQTKADALVGFDAKVSESNILGKVIALKRRNEFQMISGVYFRLLGRMIVWMTLFTAPCYPLLRKIKKLTFRFS